jgi:hypothetical protein
MFLEIINQSDSHKNPGQNINFDSLNCGNFMDSFLIISATFHRNLNYPDEGLLEVDLTNDGDFLLESFNLLISSGNDLDPMRFGQTDGLIFLKKRVQQIIPRDSLIFSFPIELKSHQPAKVIRISAQAKKRSHASSSLSTEVALY